MSRRPIERGQPFARCFLPNGRTAPTIYAVVVQDHPTITKIGRSARWQTRRRAYDNWNLAPGDAVLDFRTYTFAEEYVDLPAVEAKVLATLPFPLAFGKEWFAAHIEEVAPKLEEILEGLGLSFL